MATTTQATAPEEDHPDGPEIRRQVEFYFSDENLPHDKHMLQCCGGRANEGVSISRICGFSRMRKFQKKIVVNALRKSTFLVVSEDGKKVSRKVPLQGPCILDPEFGLDGEIAYDPRSTVPLAHPLPLLPQEKKQYPPGMSKNMMKPTGFEDTYVEPPIAPDEAKVEEAMYHPDKHFVERIELAIQRFKQKRRMHEKYSNIFNNWMRFGGVDTAHNQFGGLSQKDMAEMDAEQIARAKATHHVPWDREDRKQWEVDFVGVGEAFLSSYFPTHYVSSPEQIKTACQVLRSFYNYLIYHSVCPEYNADLAKALKTCGTAEAELHKVYAASRVLPGAFNTAASIIFGGSKAGMYAANQDWAINLKEEGVNLSDVGVMDEEARITFRTGIAIMGTEEQQAMLNIKAVKVVQDESFSLEILSITPSDELTREMYKAQNKFTAGKLHLEPLGKLVGRSWAIDDFSEWDLPKDKYPSGCLPQTEVSKKYEFWVEDSVLEDCFVGMKLDARILVLEGGIAILDDLREAMCSFYKSLPNELLMVHRPRVVNIKQKNLSGGLDEELAEKDDENGGEKFAEHESELED
ncbi:hypothetical protein BU23DRAFT_561793 [Bimuria novae-zelandiae CBS 107.79]|uniref:HTH La-type RNA-binding domain-containing protein n=1 Tax=Bimuria novae-zelandiae CBS 107.79 TaxID=1447943 RepID=A0A6A5UKX0_9PLEO|nr:hypothetical protein BU23DRAFT_561793 [Bimuria novae-zelandiae CBS 107.79]